MPVSKTLPNIGALLKKVQLQEFGWTFQERAEMISCSRRLANPGKSADSELEPIRARCKELELLRQRRLREKLERRRKPTGEERVLFQFGQQAAPTIQQGRQRPAWGLVADQVLPGLAGPCIRLPLIDVSTTFPDARQPTDVRSGLIGWQSPDDFLHLWIFSPEKGKEHQNYYCQLVWETTLVPGIHQVVRVGPSHLLVRGEHGVGALGWGASSFEASVSVTASFNAIVAEQGAELITHAATRSSDRTRSEARVKPFNLDLPLPDSATVVTRTTARLSLVALLEIQLFADSDDELSLAYIDVIQYGLPANVWADGSNVWEICRTE
jgi:hypothetical protein